MHRITPHRKKIYWGEIHAERSFHTPSRTDIPVRLSPCSPRLKVRKIRWGSFAHLDPWRSAPSQESEFIVRRLPAYGKLLARIC